MSVSCECSVLSGKGLCVGLITGPEASECDHEASIIRPWPTRDCYPLDEEKKGGLN